MSKVIPIRPVMPLSFSRLSVFEQCQARFDYQYVSKRVQDQPNEASAYGDRVHKTLEAIGKASSQSPAAGDAAKAMATTDEEKQTVKRWGPLVDSIMAKPGQKWFEHQMAVDRALQPVGWFDKGVWIRSIADVLVVDGDTAYVLDWKSGKVKDNPTQLQLFAAMVMWHFPQVQKVKTSFVWLMYDEVTNSHYERRYLDALWRALEPRFTNVQDTIDLGVFKTTPSGLCPWCPAFQICPDARPPRRKK
jgi:predicted RecB family nuclease